MYVVCNSIGSVPTHSNAIGTECSMCGAAKFHDHSSCEPCPWNKLAKCVNPFDLIQNIQTPKVDSGVTFKDEDLLIGFIDYCQSLSGLVGLAANQCSYFGERIQKRFFALKVQMDWVTILNPQIIEYIGKPIKKTEYCRTWPGKMVIAERFIKIKVVYQVLQKDKISPPITGTLIDFPAQVFQHEIDHLNGVQESFTSVLRRQNIGRNEPCICGSGKKYKNCCMKR